MQLVVAGLLYSQNWALYLLAVVGVFVIWLAWRGSTDAVRHGARRVIVAMIVGGVLYLPWLPTLKLRVVDHVPFEATFPPPPMFVAPSNS